MKALVGALFIISLSLFVPVFSQESTTGINLLSEIEKSPLLYNTPLKSRGDLTNVILDDPLMIVGNDLDSMEENILSQLLVLFGPETPIVYDDQILSYEGRSIWSYDLILIGGPNHNKLTEYLLHEGYLEVDSRKTNRPSVVIEKTVGPEDRTVLVGGDIYGYTFNVKDLPIEPLIPEAAAGAAAVLTGVGAASAAASLGSGSSATASGYGNFLSRMKNFIIGGSEEIVEEMISSKTEDKKQKIIPEEVGGFFGFTFKELGIGIFSALLFGGAYSWADTQSFSNVGIYIFAAGIAVIGHEFSHNLIASRYNLDSKFELWPSGAGLVLITSYLFGNVFATPGRNVINKKDLEKRTEGLIFLSGPMFNIIIAIIMIPFATAAGTVGLMASIGIPMNLLLAIYNLFPFQPMDGKIIKRWSLGVWIIIFLPTFLVFLWTYLI